MLLADKIKNIARESSQIRQQFSGVQTREDADFGTSLKGYRTLGGISKAAQLNRIAEVAEFLHEVSTGRRPAQHIQEAMVTDDFPILYGQTLALQVLGRYENWPVTYPSYFRITEVNDFNQVPLYTWDGGQGRLGRVTEREPYKEFAFTEGQFSLRVHKYGKRYGITLEMVINRNGEIWRDRPSVMAEAARISEEWLATEVMFDVDGPHSSFFTVPNNNIVPGNPPIGFDGINAALSLLMSRKNTDGNPVMVRGAHIVCTPADELEVKKVLEATELEFDDGTDRRFRTRNFLSGTLTYSVNPYIPLVATAATARPWIMVANPNSGTGRAAFVFGFMTGRRTPQLFMKDGNARSLGGGDVSLWDGDFDHDVMDFKVRHIFGASQMDPNMAVGSDGTGT